jgi:charged multivesicular body protein 3
MTWFACCGTPAFFGRADDDSAESMWERWWPRSLTAEEHMRHWQAELRREKRLLQRALPNIYRAKNKTKAELKAAEAKNNSRDAETHRQSLKISEQAEKRINEGAARIDAFLTELRRQAAAIRLSRAFMVSGEVMEMLGQMIKLPELRETARKLSVSMAQQGLVEDVIDVTLEEEQEGTQLEKEANAHVSKVITDSVEEIKKMPVAGSDLENEYEELGSGASTEKDLQERLLKLKSPGTAQMEE